MNRREHINEYNRVNRLFEAKYFPKVKKAIKAKISSLIDTLKAKGIEAAKAELSVDLVNADLSNVVKSLYLEVGLRYARKEYRRQRIELKNRKKPKKVLKSIKSLPIETKGFGFNEQWIAFILNYLQEFLTQKITFAVNETTRNALLEILQQGTADGVGIDEMVNRIEERSTQLTRVQAARITRTEVNRAANVGTMAGVDTSEYEMNKEWISAIDFRVRGRKPEDHADHVHLNGQVIDFDGKFKDKRSGDLLRFPGDPEASAASTVNCRCSVAPTFKEDEQGNLIPKPQPAVYAPVLGMIKPPIAASPAFAFQVGKA